MSEVTIHSNQFSNEERHPTGGYAHGVGFAIVWQDGPVHPEQGPNGATVESILAAVIDRLEFLRIDPSYVSLAIEHLGHERKDIA